MTNITNTFFKIMYNLCLYWQQGWKTHWSTHSSLLWTATEKLSWIVFYYIFSQLLPQTFPLNCWLQLKDQGWPFGCLPQILQHWPDKIEKVRFHNINRKNITFKKSPILEPKISVTLKLNSKDCLYAAEASSGKLLPLVLLGGIFIDISDLIQVP